MCNTNKQMITATVVTWVSFLVHHDDSDVALEIFLIICKWTRLFSLFQELNGSNWHPRITGSNLCVPKQPAELRYLNLLFLSLLAYSNFHKYGSPSYGEPENIRLHKSHTVAVEISLKCHFFLNKQHTKCEVTWHKITIKVCPIFLI